MQLGLTAEQRLQRRAFIGGSDAGAIVAGGQAWIDLWKEKTGRADGADLSDILPVMMGHATEPFNRFWYTKQTGRNVDRAGELQVHGMLRFLACNLDGETTTSTGERAAWQAKHVGKSGDQLVLRYTAQCTHEALCLGYDWWVMSTFVGNSRWELTEQEVDQFFAQDYVRKCAEFWRYVETDREPPEVAPLPVPPPKKLRIVQLEDEFRADWPNWGADCVEQFSVFARTLGAHQAHEISKRTIKELMPEDVGEIRRGRIKAIRDKAGAVRVSLAKGENDA